MKKLLLILAILPLFATAQTASPQGYDNMERVERGGLRALESIRFPYKSSSTWMGVHSDFYRNATDSILKFYDIKSGTDKPVIVVDGNGKIPLAYMSDALIGSVNYQGTYSVIANLPALPDAAPANKGHYYIISDSGYVAKALDSFRAGDWVISSGSAWGKVDNNNKVASVFGRIGNISAQSGDYTFAQIGSTPTTIAGYGITDAIVQGGNTFGVPVDIGATDLNDVRIIRNGAVAMTIRGPQLFGGTTQSAAWGFLSIGAATGLPGVIIHKAAANAIPVLEVTNGSDPSTGNIVDFRSNIGGTTAVRASVAKDGSIVAPNLIYQGGNSFGGNVVIGANDNNGITLKVNNGDAFSIAANGSIFGTSAYSSAMGYFQIPKSNASSFVFGKSANNSSSVMEVVNANTSSTGNIIDFQANIGGTTATRSYISKDGSFNTTGGIVATGSIAAANLANATSGNNALFRPTSTGPIISRNIADANSALQVHVLNTASTANILELFSNVGGTNAMRAYVAKNGTIQSNALIGEGDRMTVAAADGSLKAQPLPDIAPIQEIEIVIDEEDVYASISTNGTSAYVKKDGEYYNYAGGWNTTNLESDIGTFIYQIRDDSYLSINVDDEKRIKSLTLPASLPKLKSLGISGVEDPINTDFTAYTGLEDLKLTDLDATGSSITAANITKKLRLTNVIGFTTPLSNFINVKGLEVSGMSYVAVDVSSLTKLTSLSVYSNEDLTTVTLPVAPNLREIYLNDNPSLFTINIPSGALAGCKQLSVQNCNLSAEAIDAILIALDDSGSENGSGYFYGNASPTSAGEAAWDNLASKGWSIFLPE